MKNTCHILQRSWIFNLLNTDHYYKTTETDGKQNIIRREPVKRF